MTTTNDQQLAVIFDMDGTLFQTDTVLEGALNETFEYLKSIQLWSGEIPLALFREIMGAPLPKIWSTLMPNHSDSDRELTNTYFFNQIVSLINSGKGALYPHVEEIFSYLKDQQCSIFIASNGLVEYLQAIVSHYGLDRWITETFSIEQIDSLDKSDLVKVLVEKHQVVKGVVVGDRISDIQAAKKNGLMSIGCRFDFANEAELAMADVVIDNLAELQELIPARLT